MFGHRFFLCKHCGNLIGMIFKTDVPLICCGEPMIELIPNSVDASQEKHVPVVTVDGNSLTVKIGSIPHPMTDEHFIQWVYVQTEKGGQRKSLSPGDAPELTFTFVDDKPVSVFAYCNLHGLWKSDL